MVAVAAQSSDRDRASHFVGAEAVVRNEGPVLSTDGAPESERLVMAPEPEGITTDAHLDRAQQSTNRHITKSSVMVSTLVSFYIVVYFVHNTYSATELKPRTKKVDF